LAWRRWRRRRPHRNRSTRGSGASERESVCICTHNNGPRTAESLSVAARAREREIKFAALVAGWWCSLLVKHRAMSCYSNIKARHKGGGCMRMRDHSLCQCLPAAAAAEREVCVYLGSSKFVIGRKCVCHHGTRSRTHRQPKLTPASKKTVSISAAGIFFVTLCYSFPLFSLSARRDELSSRSASAVCSSSDNLLSRWRSLREFLCICDNTYVEKESECQLAINAN
jgi:hypothetical protein